MILLERARYLPPQDPDRAAETATTVLLDLDDDHRLPLLVDQATSFADDLAEHSPALAASHRTRVGAAA
ncbi:hypothetical protein ACFO4E_10480 [Nocardiopsis mangrovi]|uniref:Uncharacterized protein n=1 Tax=Nocardiopsis mangrovi TaxID=1179818 RepID=A0ABV9DUB1_9ACTN